MQPASRSANKARFADEQRRTVTPAQAGVSEVCAIPIGKVTFHWLVLLSVPILPKFNNALLLSIVFIRQLPAASVCKSD
jgi:hypothetical protein